jgi:hypothetical protein
MNEPNKIRPAFMDALEAAANLKTDRLAILEYIRQGKLKSFGGKKDNPFVRTDQVDKLAEELGLVEKTRESVPDPRAVQRNDPVRKIKLRMQQDAKWSEITIDMMRTWATEIDPVTLPTMRTIATDTIQNLETLIRIIDETEAERK